MDNQSKRASKTEFFRIYPVLIKGIEDLDTIHKFHKIFTKQKINEAKNELKNINKKLQKHQKKSSVSIKTSKKLSSINDKIINLNKSLSKQNSKFDSIDSYENLEKSEKDEIFKYDLLDEAIKKKNKNRSDNLKKALIKFLKSSSIIKNITNNLYVVESTIKKSKKYASNNTSKEDANNQIDEEMQKKVNFKLNLIVTKLSEKLTIKKYPRNKFVIKMNDLGKECFFLISGRLSILKPVEYKGIKLTYKDYFIYLKNLLNLKETDMLLQVLNSNSKFLKVKSLEEITRLIKVYFIYSLKEELKKKMNGITLLELENFFSEFNFTFNEFNIDKDNMLKEIKIKQEIDSNINIMIRNYIDDKLSLSNDDMMLLDNYSILNTEKEKRAPLASIFRYDFFDNIYPGTFFGEYALDQRVKKRSASIRTEEECYIGSLSYEYYSSLISDEIKKLKVIDLQFIINNFFFKEISSNIFNKYYYPMFKIHEMKKNEVIFDSNDNLESIYLLKDGTIKTEIYANVKDIIELIKNIIKKLYLKSSNLKITLEQIMALKKNYLKDDLIVESNENKDFILSDKIPKQLYNLYYSNGFECLGLLEYCLNINYITKCTVVSEMAIILEIHKDDLLRILQNDKEILPDYYNFVHMNAISLTKRLYFLKSNLLKKITNQINDKNNFKISENTNNANNNHKQKIEIINSEKVKSLYVPKTQRIKEKSKFSKIIMSNKFINRINDNFRKKKNTLSSLNNNNTLVKEEESSLFAKGYYDMTKSLSTSRRDNSFKKIVSLKLNENEKNYDKNISVVNIRNKILSIDSIKKRINEEKYKVKNMEKLCIVSKYSNKEEKKSLIKLIDNNQYFEEGQKMLKNGDNYSPSYIAKEINLNNIINDSTKDNICKTFRKESSCASLIPSYKSLNQKIKSLLKEMKRKQSINMGQTKFIFYRKSKMNKVYNDLIRENYNYESLRQKSATNIIKDYYLKKKIEGYSSIVNPMNNTYINRQKTFRVKTRRDFSN